MPKIRIKTVLKNDNSDNNFNGIGVLDNKVIEYNENDIKMLIYIDDLNNEITVKRISNEYRIIMNFSLDENMEGTYYINRTNTIIPIYIKTSILKIEDKHIFIKYEQTLESETVAFEFTVLYEVI